MGGYPNTNCSIACTAHGNSGLIDIHFITNLIKILKFLILIGSIDRLHRPDYGVLLDDRG